MTPPRWRAGRGSGARPGRAARRASVSRSHGRVVTGSARIGTVTRATLSPKRRVSDGGVGVRRLRVAQEGPSSQLPPSASLQYGSLIGAARASSQARVASAGERGVAGATTAAPVREGTAGVSIIATVSTSPAVIPCPASSRGLRPSAARLEEQPGPAHLRTRQPVQAALRSRPAGPGRPPMQPRASRPAPRPARSRRPGTGRSGRRGPPAAAYRPTPAASCRSLDEGGPGRVDGRRWHRPRWPACASATPAPGWRYGMVMPPSTGSSVDTAAATASGTSTTTPRPSGQVAAGPPRRPSARGRRSRTPPPSSWWRCRTPPRTAAGPGRRPARWSPAMVPGRRAPSAGRGAARPRQATGTASSSSAVPGRVTSRYDGR